MLGRNWSPLFSAIAIEDLKDVLITLGIFIALLFSLAIIVFLMKKWYGRTKEGLDADELIGDFHGMVDAGELSPEEFKKIRSSLNRLAMPIARVEPKPAPKPDKPKPPVSDEPV